MMSDNNEVHSVSSDSGSGSGSVSDASWIVFQSCENEDIKRDESLNGGNQQDFKDENLRIPLANSTTNDTLQLDCDSEIETTRTSGYGSVSDASWIVFQSSENEDIKRDESLNGENQQDFKGEENKEDVNVGIPLANSTTDDSSQLDCDNETETAGMFYSTPIAPVDCDLSDGISIISENEGAVVGKPSTPFTRLPPFSGLYHTTNVGFTKSPSFTRNVIKRKNISFLRKRKILLNFRKNRNVKDYQKTEDTVFTPPRMFLAFLVLCAIPITIMQYSINRKNNVRMDDLINRVDIITNELLNLHKDMVQIKDDINLKKLLFSLVENNMDNDKTEDDRNVLLGSMNNIYDKIFGSNGNNDGVKSESKELPTTDNWKEAYKHDKHQHDYKNKYFNNKNQKFEKNYKDTSQRKHNTDNHFKYDKYSNEKIKEKYAKGETNQEFPKDDHHKHFNNNDKRIKDFEYNKKHDHDDDDDKDWYQNMMDQRQKYRTEKQNKDKYNWYIQRGDERERIRDNDVKYR